MIIIYKISCIQFTYYYTIEDFFALNATKSLKKCLFSFVNYAFPLKYKSLNFTYRRYYCFLAHLLFWWDNMYFQIAIFHHPLQNPENAIEIIYDGKIPASCNVFLVGAKTTNPTNIAVAIDATKKYKASKAFLGTAHGPSPFPNSS